MAVPILLKFGRPIHYKMTKLKNKFLAAKIFGGLVFCANLIFGGLVFCANLISRPSCLLCKSYFCCSFRTAVPIWLKFGTPIHYEMTKRKKITGGHFVFFANLISALA